MKLKTNGFYNFFLKIIQNEGNSFQVPRSFPTKERSKTQEIAPHELPQMLCSMHLGRLREAIHCCPWHPAPPAVGHAPSTL